MSGIVSYRVGDMMCGRGEQIYGVMLQSYRLARQTTTYPRDRALKLIHWNEYTNKPNTLPSEMIHPTAFILKIIEENVFISPSSCIHFTFGSPMHKRFDEGARLFHAQYIFCLF